MRRALFVILIARSLGLVHVARLPPAVVQSCLASRCDAPALPCAAPWRGALQFRPARQRGR